MNIIKHKGQRIYLASPYSNEDKLLVYQRYLHTLESTSVLAEAGIFVFSPIVYCHTLAEKHGLPGDFEYWKAFNWTWIEWANQFWIDAQPGWAQSDGVQRELVFADSQKKPALLYYYGQGDDSLKEIE